MKVMIDNKEYENLKKDVKDINDSKLPNYVKKQEESEPYVSNIQHSGDDVVLKVEDTEGGGACVVTLENGEFNVTLGDETNNYMLGLTNTGEFTIQTKEGETIHSLTFDSEGNLKVDGNAVGGGKQLYQHNIWIIYNSKEYLVTYYNYNENPTITNDNYIDFYNVVKNNFNQRFNMIGTNETILVYINVNNELNRVYNTQLELMPSTYFTTIRESVKAVS